MEQKITTKTKKFKRQPIKQHKELILDQRYRSRVIPNKKKQELYRELSKQELSELLEDLKEGYDYENKI